MKKLANSKVRNNINMFFNLSINDFKSKYASSILGAVWVYVQPLMNLLVMWYVFQVGLKNGNVEGVPFIVWFAPASLAWSFVAECISSETMCMKEYSYLVCKVNFDVKIIPLIKVASGCFVHVAFIIFLYFLCAVYHVPFTVYSLQILYYFVCMIVHLIGLGWLLSVVTPFFPDMQAIVNVILQMGFWITPIVWNVNDMSLFVQRISKLNPMYYIVTGYRDSLVNHIWFWERWDTTIYYWTITIFLLVFGHRIFNKVKKHLADVL